MRPLPMALIGGAALALTACVAIQNEEAEGTERQLAAAGFQIRPADSQQRLAAIGQMPQRRIVRHDVGGSIRYVYANAEGCGCIYAGTQENYDQFQLLAEEQRLATEQAAAEMDWELWGPWNDFGWADTF